MKSMPSGTRKERGQALIIFALGVAALMGFVALAIDVGLVFESRRSAQNAADAAALAGASALPANGASAVSLAQDWAQRNGFQNGKNGVTVKVTTPYNGDPSKIEVAITTSQPAVFAVLVGEKSFPVTARAVATRSNSSGINAAFLVLDPTLCKSFNKSGSANLVINNKGGIMDDSSCNPSISRQGGGSVTAAAINYYKPGGYVEGGSGQFVPAPAAVDNRVADPLASTAPPNLNTLGQSPDSGGTPKSPALKSLSSGNATLHPGVYYGGIEIKSSANVTFQPGIYALAGGGLKVTGSGTIQGAGVMFYNTFDPQKNSGAGACGGIDLTGGANFNFTGLTSGSYKDIVFWQDKACTNDYKLAGGNGGVGGLIYTPGARVNLSGGGNLGSIEVIANSVDISGTGDLTVNFYPYLPIPISTSAKLVE